MRAARTGDRASRAVFATGSLLVVAGVALHLPAYWSMRDEHFEMAGMGMDPAMTTGMVLMVLGLGAAARSLLPARERTAARAPEIRTRYAALDGARFGRAHRGLVVVLSVALVVDTMKPASLGFTVPGMRAEYGLTAAQASLLPLVAIGGTIVGSVLWGWLADLYGRRSTILLSALMYVATSVCGFMPSFGWNLVMCALMGMAAGGMLPTVYSLMSESVPARRRGWIVVAQSGFSAAAGYLVASGCATLLVPHYSWRVLWLLGLPTGLLLVVLRRWIPESPRFLIETGQQEEAARVMARYGIRAVPADAADVADVADAGETATGVGTGTPAAATPALDTDLDTDRDPRANRPAPRGPLAAPRTTGAGAGPRRFAQLLSAPYRGQTWVIVLFGVSWGIVNWGFITFLPNFLTSAGSSTRASSLLFVSSALAVPATLVAAALYARWSSRKAMCLYAAATALVLVGYAVLRPERAGHGDALVVLTALLLITSGGMVALLAPYATEVYPTALRATGSGVAAAGGKAGGLFGPLLLSSAPRLEGLALVSAVPLVAAGLVLWRYGAETRGRALVEADGPARPAGIVRTPADT
ncbi:MFS transporter [Streptomyces sp. NPDC006012]|uniref:MFS transporter n=1 Tax=Streptomyces sp. NPDC006012 TaxID=3364739 RepID=UPI00367DB8F7